MKLIPDINGVLTIAPLPTENVVKRFYEQKYYQEKTGQYTGEYSQEEIDYFNYTDKILHHFISKLIPGANRILDLGCGEGFTLKYFLSMGYECFGSDFSVAGIQSQNPQLIDRITFFQGDVINEDFFIGEKFDCVACKNIFEHVIDFYGFLEKARSKLISGGILFVQVPNEYGPLQNSYMKRTGIDKKEDCPWYVPPEHLRYFSFKSLRLAMERNEFQTLALMGDFPIDVFLLDERTDYYANNFGKTAHSLRIKFQNIIGQDVESSISYGEVLANLNLGRNIIGVFRKL